jgi:tetratricopeptide (TPR) repeat protein
MLKRFPAHAQALHVLSSALLMQGRVADAITALEPAARAQHNPMIDTQLAVALRQAGREVDAEARLQRATKRRPPYAPAFYELGSLLFALKRYAEAAETLKRGLDAAPTMPELSIQLGHTLLALRKSADAKAVFAKALQLAPESAGALWGMGKAHQQIGENRAAIDYFRRCFRYTPDDLGTWLNLGHSLLEVGDFKAGYECFRTAARGDPKRYYAALTTLVKTGRGRFWLKPSDAARALRGESD